MTTPYEPAVRLAAPAPRVAPGRPMRMGRSRWVPPGILAKVDEVIVPVAPPPQYQEKVILEAVEEPQEEEALLPEGTPLLTVAGVNLPENAVGPALEFLEFCSAFYKPLGMKKADGEKALHEIGKGCNVKKGNQCPAVQVHVRLLSVILYESDEPCNVSCGVKCKSSWLEVLKKYLHRRINPRLKTTQSKDADGEEEKLKEADSARPSKSSPPLTDSVASPIKSTSPPVQESMHKFAASLEGGADGYESLDIEGKLQLLNMLCNDTLSTAVIRNYIEKVIFESDEKRKEERERSRAAKKKAKLDHEKQKQILVAAMKDQGDQRLQQLAESVAKTRAEALKESIWDSHCSKESGNRASETLRSDAVRTDAVLWDRGARAVWKLKGGIDRTIVAVQDVTSDDGIPKERWTVYSEKDEEVLAVYLEQQKNGRRKARKQYQLKTLESHPISSADAATDAMLSPMSPSSSDNNRSDQDSETDD